MSSTNQSSECMIGIFTILGIFTLVGGIITIIMSDGEQVALEAAFFVASPVFFVLAFVAFRRRRAVSIETKVVGIARGHARVTMEELSQLAKLPVDKVRNALYSAIASGMIQGTIEGNTFVRSAPAAAMSGTSTREREVVKVLVVCPFCGAKTEQGLAKCQNCQADL